MEGGVKGPKVFNPKPIIPIQPKIRGDFPKALGIAPSSTSALKEQLRQTYAPTKATGVKITPPVAVDIPQSPIWDRILFGKVSEAEKSDATEVLGRLAFFDSIHDFWPERGKKKVTEEDAEEPEEIDPQERIDNVHAKLVKSIQSYTGSDEGIEDILVAYTKGAIRSVSGIEDKVLAYLKETYKPFNEQEATITLTEILTNWKFGKAHKSWDAYRAAILRLPSNLEISLDGKFIKSLENNELGYLGFFILAYLNPNVNPGNSNVNLTFDMIPRDIGRIFERFTQVKNAIYPQNVADSATTSFSALQGRSVFHRADYQVATVTNSKPLGHAARSNAFTRDKYDIVFVDNGFSSKNRLGFSIEVRTKGTTNPVAKIPFGRGKEQGPSVNYLMDLLSSENPGAVKPKLDKVAEIKDVKEIDQDLLFDIKRLGDQEQMLVTTAYAVTGDRFAAVFRRLLRMPGIFHSSRGFRLWRGNGLPKGVLPPPVNPEAEAESQRQAREFRKQQVITKLQLVAGIMSKVPEIRTELEKMKTQVSEGGRAGKVFTDPIPINGVLTRDYIDANYTGIASTFATYILRTRMADIENQIDNLLAKIDAIAVSPEIKNASCIVDPPPQAVPLNAEACPPQEVTEEIITQSLDKLEEFIKSIEELDALKIPAFVKKEGEELTFAPPPMYVKLFSEDGRLLKGVTSDLFNFSSDAFLHPETGLAPMVGRLLSLSRSAQLGVISDQINKLLVRYFQSRDAIKEAFFNKERKDSVEENTDITSGIDAPRVVALGVADGARGLFDVIQSVAASGEEAFGVPGVVAVGGGEQSGGADGSVLQFRDLHDLFVQICLDAQHALIIEKDPVAALNDIQVKWELEVSQNREYAVDYYGVAFEETATTNFISFLLSFRSDGSSIFPEDAARREEVALNDIAGILLQQVPVEPYILEVLAVIGKQIINVSNFVAATKRDPEEDKITGTYASPAEWKDRLPVLIETFLRNKEPPREVLGLVRGGGDLEGGDDTPTNAAVPSGSSRRRLYQGLRKRAGSGSSSEL